MENIHFSRQIFFAVIAFTILSILGFGIVPAHQPLQQKSIYNESHLSAEIPEEIAETMTHNFRTLYPNETKAVVHDISKLMAFINENILPHTRNINPPSGYEWRLAVSPMYYSDEHKQMCLTVGFLPCLQSTSCPGDILEYWTCKSNQDNFYLEYFKPLMDTVKKAGHSSFIFDEGQLWP